MAVLPAHTQNLMSESYQGSSPNARFLAGDVPGGKTPLGRISTAMSVSWATHIAGLLLLLFVVSRLPAVNATAQADKALDIVWTAVAGPGGGGGGGGNRTPDPPRKVEAPGKEKITVPVAKPPKLEPPKENKVEQPLTIPAQPMASAVETLPGAVSAVPTAPISQGAGSGGGSGTGTGTGSGAGQGSGLGQGSGGGTGGGVYRPGNGVTPPVLIGEVKPTYTGEAMRAKIQGIVTMEAVVMPDGSVTNVHITRSLDDRFGLDQEAILTVKKWRFRPGTRLGLPVPVLVEIEMQFTLR